MMPIVTFLEGLIVYTRLWQPVKLFPMVVQLILVWMIQKNLILKAFDTTPCLPWRSSVIWTNFLVVKRVLLHWLYYLPFTGKLVEPSASGQGLKKWICLLVTNHHPFLSWMKWMLLWTTLMSLLSLLTSESMQVTTSSSLSFRWRTRYTRRRKA